MAILDALTNGRFINTFPKNNWDATNSGAILFARDIQQFRSSKSRSVQIIVYKNSTKTDGLKEQEYDRGYATGFEGLIKYVMDQLPVNEIIDHALREIC